jgi:RNA polymerase sigma factor (sigma-70 family)
MDQRRTGRNEDAPGDAEDDERGGPAASVEQAFAAAKDSSAAELLEFRARFPSFYREYGPRVLRMLAWWRVNPQSRRDLHQDTFAMLFELVQSKKRVPADVWWTIRAITWRLICNYLRGRKKRSRLDYGVDLDTIQEKGDAARQLLLQMIANEAAAHLGEQDAKLLLMVDVEGKKYKDVSAALGIATGTVGARVHHARRRFIEWIHRNDDTEGGT